MAYTPSYPTAENTFIPTMNGEATAGLVTNFSRNPRDFALPRWVTYTPTRKWKGYFLRMNIDQCARVLDPANVNNLWPRGLTAPQLTWNTEGFGWMPFTTERYLYGFQLPDEAESMGDFSPTTQNNAVEAQRAMTARAVKTINTALTTSNYDSSHVDTAANWGGGYVGSGTSTNPIFKRTLETMYRRIHLDTRGTVRPRDMVVVLHPAVAHIISQSAEIHDYLKGSPDAVKQMRGGVDGQNDTWGLPPTYADFKIVVEDTVMNTNPKGVADQTGTYAWTWSKIAMFARPGGLIAPEGSVSFSTVHIFLHEDMAVEQFDDRQNRRFTSRFVDDFGEQVVAPVSGAICTAALASEPSSMFPGTIPPSDFPGSGGSLTLPVNAAETERQIKEMSEFMAELRAENARLRDETADLRRTLEGIAAMGSTSPDKPAEKAPEPTRKK